MSCRCDRDYADIDVMDVEMTEFGFEWVAWCSKCGWSVQRNIAVDWEYVEEIDNEA